MAKIGLPDITTRKVKLEGFTPIMFDRYAGDNKTKLPEEELFYFMPGTQQLCIPSLNISSFLSSRNSTSVAKLIGGKAYGTLANALLSFVQISPMYIPMTRGDEPITFHGFKDGVDAESNIFLIEHTARLKGGIPNPKVRPVVELPWSLTFNLSLLRNEEVDETLLLGAFKQGGVAIGLGTFRGVYGKFTVTEWE